MDVMELEIVVKNIDLRLTRIVQILPTLATKDDLEGFPTRGDSKGFATKDDLKGFATKRDVIEESERTRHQFNAVAERIEGYVRVVAEGHGALEQLLAETNHRYEQAVARLDRRVTRLEARLVSDRTRWAFTQRQRRRERTMATPRFSARAAILTALVGAGAAVVFAQGRVDPRLLAAKKGLADQQQAALVVPFTGVRTADGVRPDLFPIRATGVSTEPLRSAAIAFLATLTPAQIIRTVFAVDDSEWRRWSNVDNGIYVRQGVSLREMTYEQRRAGMALVRASLGAKGLALAENIMKTDQTLREINNDINRYDEQLYFFTMLGQPSATEPWGWQLEGHHLVINYFVQQDQVVMTPLFVGGEPVVTTTGKYAGNAILQGEQDAGLAFMRALDSSQQGAATLAKEKTRDDLQAGMNQDNLVLPYQGLRADGLSPALKASLRALIALYVGNMRDDQAHLRTQEVDAHLDETWFAWTGGTMDADPFYYRIHSPVILIEFDHQRPVGTTSINTPGRPTKAHIHVIVRTPNGNDYGKDLLRQHLTTHPH
jgi:hypothetical protein